MPTFPGAAPLAADKQLFKNAPASLVALNKSARKGLRQKARQDYWTAQQDLASQTASSPNASVVPSPETIALEQTQADVATSI